MVKRIGNTFELTSQERGVVTPPGRPPCVSFRAARTIGWTNVRVVRIPTRARVLSISPFSGDVAPDL